MALVLKDRVKETTTTTGTGTYTLAGAVSGFEAFSEIGNSNTTYYCCTDGTDFEVGIGTYTASGTTLARTTILQSSNSDAAVNWTSGTRTIFCTQPAEKAVFLNDDGDIEFDNTHRILITSNASDPVLAIAGGGPNFIRFHDAVGFSSTTNAVDIVYRTTPNDLLIERASGENIAEFGGDDGHAALYFNDSKKLETVSGGIDVTGEIAATSLDISGDVDVDGTLEADAITLNGTAITTTATLSTGISNNNVPKFTSGVADNDFLRVDGTAIEGRSASQVLSDIGAATSAQGSTADSALQDVSDDTSPTLGGALSTGGNQIQLTQTSGNAIVTTGSLASADLGILRASAGTGGSDTHGFTIKYMGSRSGNNNSFSLFMDNQAGTDVEAITVIQDGKVGILNTSPGSALDVTGEIAATSLDISGDVDVDGTLEADAITLNGTALAASATTDTTNASNISSGTLPNARLDAQLQDVAGLAVTNGNFIVGDGSNFVAESGATARASLGLGTAATSATGDFATAAQGSTADSAMQDLVDDTSPQLGGVLDTNGNNIEFGDSTGAEVERLKFGAGDDLQIWHDGTHSYIAELGTGGLRFASDNQFDFRSGALDEKFAVFNNDGAVELYHDNAKKLETTADGVDIVSTDAGSGIGPSLHLYRNSASPADFDDLGALLFTGNNSAGDRHEYSSIRGEVADVTDGTEDAYIRYFTNVGGSSLEHMVHAFGGTTITGQLYLKGNAIHSNPHLKFEGSTANDHETTFNVTDPTADRTITLPDATGTVQLTDGSGASLTSLNASELGSGTVPNARLDAQLQDVAGLAVTNGGFIVGDGSNFVLETGATARTSLGLGTAAVAATGISNGNVPVFTSGVADNDFLRVNGTSIEGRSASELASDIGASTTDEATALAIALG